jgi:transposase
MTRAYSVDLRERVVQPVSGGGSVRAMAAMFAVSPSFVAKLSQAWRRRGTVAAQRQGGDRRSAAIEGHREWLLQLVGEEPDLTLAESRSRLGQRGLSASISAIWRFFNRHGISFKKNRARRRAGPPGRGGSATRMATQPKRAQPPIAAAPGVALSAPPRAHGPRSAVRCPPIGGVLAPSVSGPVNYPAALKRHDNSRIGRWSFSPAREAESR